MWRVIQTVEFARQAKWYQKKKNQEFRAVHNNLERFMDILNSGHQPAQLVFHFIHSEAAGVVALDQSGAGKKLAATRLYLYAYVERETVYLLTIGDKRSQNDDVQNCKRAVEFIKANPDFGIPDSTETETEDDETERD